MKTAHSNTAEQYVNDSGMGLSESPGVPNFLVLRAHRRDGLIMAVSPAAAERSVRA